MKTQPQQGAVGRGGNSMDTSVNMNPLPEKGMPRRPGGI
jgi:hypothetical protein